VVRSAAKRLWAEREGPTRLGPRDGSQLQNRGAPETYGAIGFGAGASVRAFLGRPNLGLRTIPAFFVGRPRISSISGDSNRCLSTFRAINNSGINRKARREAEYLGCMRRR